MIDKDRNFPTDDHGANKNFKIKGLDVKKGIAMTGGKKEKYKEVLAIFHKDTIIKINEIRKSLESGDIKLYIIYVHALKSAAAIIGSESLSEAAMALENAGKQGDTDFIHVNNTKFISELETLLDNINSFFLEESGNQKEPSDKKLLKTGLIMLRAALIAMDSNVINSASDSLQSFIHAPDVGDTVSNILQNKLVGAYDDAVLLIDALLSDLKNI